MTFKKLTSTQYPRRQWALAGYPASGKSTFAAQMAGPLLVVDADHRFGEVAAMAAGDVYEVSDNPADHVDAERIVAQLKAHMQGSSVRTIVVDSLTAVITPLVTAAILDNDAGANRNKVAAFKPKALAMRLLQDEITGWGVDTLWIYHFRLGLDAQARQAESTSITRVELARLRRSLNMELKMVQESAKWGIVVTWARRGRYPVTLWDETGGWTGMPERIEEAVYSGLTKSEMDSLEKALPVTFRSPTDAIAWGLEQGCFRDAVHAQNAYEVLKREKSPSSASEMRKLWIENVLERRADMGAPDDEEYDHLQVALANPLMS